MIGGLTQYPGNYYLPGLFTPVSQFPVAAVTIFANDPTGPSTVPGAAVGRLNLHIPLSVSGDFVLQAALFDFAPGSALNNTWTMSNALRVVF